MAERDARVPAAGQSDCVSRRDFLKVAGVGGSQRSALGGGLGGLLAACGGTEESRPRPTETTATGDDGHRLARPPHRHRPATTTTSASAGAEEGDEVKAGYVIPITGSMAAFGVAANWHIDWFNKNVWKDGLLMGDGKKHKFTVIVKDMQSDSNRAAQVAQDLILNEKVMLIGASASAANVVPGPGSGGELRLPVHHLRLPGRRLERRPARRRLQVVLAHLVHLAGTWRPTSWRMWEHDPDQQDGRRALSQRRATVRRSPPLCRWSSRPRATATWIPGATRTGPRTTRAIIGQMRKEGVEIVNGVPTPPDYANFWKQAVQQGFRPKISTEAKAMLLPRRRERSWRPGRWPDGGVLVPPHLPVHEHRHRA